MENQTIAERGLICRTFYARKGEQIHQTFVKAKATGVSVDWFTDPTCKVIWMAAEELFSEIGLKKTSVIQLTERCKVVASRQKDITLRAVTVKYDDFADYEKVVAVDDSIDSFAKTIRDGYIVRNAKIQMAVAVEQFANGEDPAMVISRLIGNSQNVLKSQAPCKQLSISDLCDKAISDWDEAYHQRTELGNYEWCSGLSLPWRKLSYALDGFNPDMTVLAARPGVGKTSMALNFTRHWLDIGKKVTFVSVDMSPIGFVKRQLSERSCISSRKLQFGKSMKYKEDRQRIVDEAKVLKELEKSGNFNLLAEYDVDVIRAYCSILKEQNEIDVLVVDYIQLLKFKGSERLTSVAKTTYVSNTLHEIANELQIPVLCLSQLNRDNTKDGGRDPQLSDLRDSGAIEQDAANVLLLYRNETLNTKWKESEPPVQFAKNRQDNHGLRAYCPIWCLVAKAREGDCGTKLPFVVVQNKYSWYLGDYEAEGDEKFARVYDDWRHDPIERVWDENGALIRMDTVRAIERANINNERRAMGMDPIAFTEQFARASAQNAQEEDIPF